MRNIADATWTCARCRCPYKAGHLCGGLAGLRGDLRKAKRNVERLEQLIHEEENCRRKSA